MNQEIHPGRNSRVWNGRAGDLEDLVENAGSLRKILGVELVPARASVRDLSKERKVPINPEVLTTDSLSIVDDPEIDLVCELMGGIEEARELTLRAFGNGKSVVTANKALICEHGEELFSAAEEAGVRYAFEASVAGGIPIIKVLRESLVANEFPLIYGILNGTSIYPYPYGKRGSEFSGSFPMLGNLAMWKPTNP